MNKKTQRILVFSLFFCWVFTGWPQAAIEVGTFSLQFPVEIPYAYALITASSTPYATAGTFDYKVSTNACEVVVAAWGGGGAGITGGNNGGGAGGGGGGFASSTLTNLVEGNTYTIVVGAGGTASEGDNGADSTFDTAVVVADAGGGGTSNTTGEGTGGTVNTGDVTANGGVGGSGNGGDDSGGGGGGAGGPHGAGGDGGDADTTQGGGGGGGNGGNPGGTPTGGTSTFGGAGGLGDSNGSAEPPGAVGTTDVDGGGGGGGGDQADPGGNGGAPGGGGAGGEGGFGTGASGQIIITEYVNDAGCFITPTVTTDFASNVGATTARLNGAKTGGTNATGHGFAYSTDSAFITSVTTTTLGALTSNSAFNSFINSLTADQTYFFRAYATNTAGIGYGVTRSFLTGNTNVTRTLRLFQNYRMKFIEGRILFNQR